MVKAWLEKSSPLLIQASRSARFIFGMKGTKRLLKVWRSLTIALLKKIKVKIALLKKIKVTIALLKKIKIKIADNQARFECKGKNKH